MQGLRPRKAEGTVADPHQERALSCVFQGLRSQDKGVGLGAVRPRPRLGEESGLGVQILLFIPNCDGSRPASLPSAPLMPVPRPHRSPAGDEIGSTCAKDMLFVFHLMRSL